MNRIVPTLLLIVLLVFLGGFLWVYTGGNFEQWFQWKIKRQEVPPVAYEVQIQEENKNAENDAENYNMALKEKRLTFCENIHDAPKKEECRDMIGAAQALSEKSTDLCSALSKKDIRERCFDNVSYFLAEESGDSSLCDKIQDETIKTQCTKSIEEKNLESHIASGSLEVSFCETISDQGLMDECKRKISTEKDSVFYREAVAATSLMYCDSISDRMTQSKCKDSVLFDLAVKEGNLDYCSSINDTERSDHCRKSLLWRLDVSKYQQFVRTGNLESCNELSVIQMRNQCRDTIIFAKVRETRDESLCELLYNSGITTQCHELLVKGQK